MAWANAFDEGACTVKVGNAVTPDAYFSGVLGKGETSSPFGGKLGGEMLVASVTSAGEVKLNWLSGNGPAVGYTLYVVPAYALGTRSMRVRGIVMPDGVSGSAAAWSDDAGNVYVPLTLGESWSPDPADISDPGSQSYWAVYAGEIL